MPEEHHLYSALQAQTSPGIQTYRDAPLPARHRPGATLTHAAVWCSRGVCRAGSGASL